MKMVRANVIVTGLVQGVFYRANTVEIAQSFTLTGWIKNNPNGSVEAIFEGDERSIMDMIEWCGKGPSSARVENVNVTWNEYKNEFSDFTVR